MRAAIYNHNNRVMILEREGGREGGRERESTRTWL